MRSYCFLFCNFCIRVVFIPPFFLFIAMFLYVGESIVFSPIVDNRDISETDYNLAMRDGSLLLPRDVYDTGLHFSKFIQELRRSSHRHSVICGVPNQFCFSMFL